MFAGTQAAALQDPWLKTKYLPQRVKVCKPFYGQVSFCGRGQVIYPRHNPNRTG